MTLNSAYFNQCPGITAGSGSTVTGNTASNNRSDGIASSGSTLTNNTAYNNGDIASEDGIDCGFGCSVRGNTVRSNAGFGLRLGTDSAHRENVVNGNTAGTVTGTGTNVGNNHCAGPGVVSASCP